MSQQLLDQEVLDFIKENENTNLADLALKKSPFEGVSMKKIVQQVQGRRIAKRKFPSLLEYDQYQYPVKVSLEQASSEQTAIFKSNFMQGEKLVDLTGGMGIDAFFLSREFKSTTYIEPNEALFNQTLENFTVLGIEDFKGYNQTCEAFLESNIDIYDWAYIDPSRRIDGKRKISIQNYEPNLVELYPKIMKIAKNVMIKLSPIQDISECLFAFNAIHMICVISVQNEVKELLVHLKPGTESPELVSVDISKDREVVYCASMKDRTEKAELDSLKRYLYQPMASIVKSGIQDSYCKNLGINKMNPNTQLYTSDELVEGFYGRIFEVRNVTTLNKKRIKSVLPEMKANVISKNFPLSSDQIKAKIKVADGGEDYLIAFKGMNDKKLVSICKRLV